MKQQADLSATKFFLFGLIRQQASEKALLWLDQQVEKLRDQRTERPFFLAFSSASRFFEKEPLQLSANEVAAADQLRKGFQPAGWTLLQTARTYLLLLLPQEDADSYIARLDKLFETADMDEQLALYGALPVLPYPEALTKRTSEGIRTNMTPVFDAIALQNPFPADFLDQPAWNQMLLKAVFMQRPLYKIYGADQRANPELTAMLLDFAHERWAAGRKVMPELWRFVGPFLEDKHLPDIEKTIARGDALEKEACLLACHLSPSPAAKSLLQQYPDFLKNDIQAQESWRKIGEASVF
jgi:hypothetical protein